VVRPAIFDRLHQEICPERIDINRSPGTIIQGRLNLLNLLRQANKLLKAPSNNLESNVFHHASPKRNSQPSRRPRSAVLLFYYSHTKSNRSKATMMLPLRSTLTPIPRLTQPTSTLKAKPFSSQEHPEALAEPCVSPSQRLGLLDS
jgi:hypothetical protein